MCLTIPRGPEPLSWFSYLEKGGTTYPLSIVKTVDTESLALSDEQKARKKDAAESRSPHKTVAQVEVLKSQYLY